MGFTSASSAAWMRCPASSAMGARAELAGTSAIRSRRGLRQRCGRCLCGPRRARQQRGDALVDLEGAVEGPGFQAPRMTWDRVEVLGETPNLWSLSASVSRPKHDGVDEGGIEFDAPGEVHSGLGEPCGGCMRPGRGSSFDVC